MNGCSSFPIDSPDSDGRLSRGPGDCCCAFFDRRRRKRRIAPTTSPTNRRNPSGTAAPIAIFSFLLRLPIGLSAMMEEAATSSEVLRELKLLKPSLVEMLKAVLMASPRGPVSAVYAVLVEYFARWDVLWVRARWLTVPAWLCGGLIWWTRA